LHKNIALTGLLVYVTLSAPTSLLAAEAQDCSLKRYASIDLEESPNGHLLVPVTVEGTRALMLLDTDTIYSTLTEAAVDRLALQTHSSSITVKTLTGETYIPKIATAKELSIGSAKFKTREFYVPLTSNISIIAARDYSNAQVVGVIGMDVLANVDVELDVASRKMNLYSQDHCPNHVVYWSKVYNSVPIHLYTRGSAFYFPIELDGKKIEATLSTWQSTTTLSTDVTRKLYNFDSHSPDVESETDTAGKTMAHYRAMELDAVGFKVVNAHITLIDPRIGNCHLGTRFDAAAYDCEGSPPLRLGLNVLTRLHIYLATKEKVLYFTPAEATGQR
jgi:hypothetical protein